MPTNRRYRSRGRAAGIAPAVYYYLRHGHMPTRSEEQEVHEGWLDCFLMASAGREAEVWREIAEAEVRAWAADQPGTRPWAWWLFDAPEPRRRLGGIGTPCCEVLNYAPRYAWGLPVDWVTAFDAAYYRGEATDVQGRPIGQEFAGRTFAGQAIDPDDPPRYESEAAYLDRLGLFLPGEQRRVPAEGWQDEVLHDHEDDDAD